MSEATGLQLHNVVVFDVERHQVDGQADWHLTQLVVVQVERGQHLQATECVVLDLADAAVVEVEIEQQWIAVQVTAPDHLRVGGRNENTNAVG